MQKSLRRAWARPLIAILATAVGLAIVAPAASRAATLPADYILMPRAELLSLPMSGAGWTNLLGAANSGASTPDIANQDDNNDVLVLAKALVFARTGDVRYRTEVMTLLRGAVGTEVGGRTLALARNLAPLALAADLITLRTADATFDTGRFRPWLKSTMTENLDGRTLISTHEDRPNNWGTHSGASRIAVDLYLGDSVDLARAAAVFKGYLGDRTSYAGFQYGDVTWQANAATPVGINPKGATKSGMNIDGIIPDDMRRGGSFSTIGPDGVNYTWEALQGVLLQSELLTRAGYPAFTWQDSAPLRAFSRITALGYPAAGDDVFQPWLINFRYGTSYATATARPGKSFGYTDWLYGGRRAGAVPPPTPAPTVTPAPTATPAPSPTTAPAPTPAPTPTTAPAATPAPTATPAPSAAPVAGGTVTIIAGGDAEVKSAYPTKNYGTATTIRVRGGATDVHTSYLTFTVPALSKPVAAASLRLHVTDGSKDAGSVYRIGSTCIEMTVTYATAPAVGSTKIGTIGTVAAGAWITVPLSGTFAAGETVTIALATSGTDSAIFDSRETAADPTLVLTLAP
jgi:hypothetical protein